MPFFLKKGNKNSWCEINFADQIEFKHNRSRNFPIYYTDNTVASFKFDDAHFLPIDGKLVDNGINFTLAYELDFFPILNNNEIKSSNKFSIKNLDFGRSSCLATNVVSHELRFE